ncbi:MAG: pirin family protein [Caulobacteraceae bacterium]
MIEMVIDARRKDLGELEVGRILPFHRRRMVGPFVFLDHMGPADFQPGMGINVRPHPHIGLSTVTYLFDGEILHRDNLGYTQAIRPGEVNWMTAGRGIVHSERTDPSIRSTGGLMHGMQAWVALPLEAEETEPGFDHYGVEDLVTYDSGTGLWARLVAGEAFGAKSGVKTSSPMFYVHWELKAGVTAGLQPEYSERAAYVARGSVEVDGQVFHSGQMLVFAAGDTIPVKAVTDATVMLLGGEPVGERIVWWNLVASSQDKIEAAKADWANLASSGRFTLPPEDNQEFIPLPEDWKPEPSPPGPN